MRKKMKELEILKGIISDQKKIVDVMTDVIKDMAQDLENKTKEAESFFNIINNNNLVTNTPPSPEVATLSKEERST